MHQNGTLNKSEPISDEGFKIYVHNPDDPIVTIGGANMIVRVPQDSIRIPASDFIIPFNDFFNFMAGNSGLPDITVEASVTIGGFIDSILVTTFPVPAPAEAIFPGLDTGGVETPKFVDFLDSIPNVQFYVVGDQLDNTVGNYWFGNDTFPLSKDIEWTKMYMHQNGTLNKSEPISDEGFKIYVHNPDDPIVTIGGANMIVRVPQDSINSQGQMDLAHPAFAPYTMNRPGVVSFTSPAITEANGYVGDSLCIIRPVLEMCKAGPLILISLSAYSMCILMDENYSL